MAPSSMEKSAMVVTEKANVAAQQWHQHHSGHQPLRRPDEGSAGHVCGIQNTFQGQVKSFAPMAMEEPLADIWTAEEADAAFDSRGLLPLPAAVQTDHPHQQQHRSFAPCVSLPRHHNHRPLHPQHQQSQNGMPTFPMANEGVFGHTTLLRSRNHHNSRTTADGACHQRALQHRQGGGGGAGPAMGISCNGEKTTGNDHSSGLGHGGRVRCGRTVDGMGGGSPKSSVSSDESASGLAENSPSAVWEVQMRREGFTGGGGRKRVFEAADTNATAPLQPQATTAQDVVSLDDLKQLLCTSMEQESAGTSAREETRNKGRNLKQLLQFIKMTMLERDEARDQLQKLHAEIAAQHSPHEHSPTPPLHLHHGLASSPAVLPNPSMANCDDTAKFDPASAVIARLAMNKALPEKGKLLQAVLDAGPLLRTLLVAGTLPRWRNPPPLQPFQIPPVSATLNQNATVNKSFLAQTCPKFFHHQNPDVAMPLPGRPQEWKLGGH